MTSSKLATGAIDTTKIADGAVTDAKILGVISGAKLGAHGHNGSDIVDGTITSTKIADGAITDAKITGPISASKIQGIGSDLNADLLDGLDSSAFSKRIANVITVAKSAGDFDSVQAAIDSINPTVDNPYLIKVMPGKYIENITMKSYVHLQGAGSDITIIQSPSTANNVITLNALTAVTISDISIIGGNYGISNLHSSPTIRRNKIAANDVGIWHWESSSIIIDNIISNNRRGINTVTGGSTIIQNTITGNTEWGIWEQSGGSATIKGNIIIGNGNGIFIHSTPNITENTITGNNGSGIHLYVGSATIYRNTITGNGLDISMEASSATVSFNVYDTFWGTSALVVGMYNVKSDGSPVSIP